MDECCFNRLGSGGADEPGVVFNPNDTERASLEAAQGLLTSNNERVLLGANKGQAINSTRSLVGGSRKVGKRGKTKHWWTLEERKVLWECFVRGGGKKSGGYIKKVKALWDERGLSVREVPSLLSQLKGIENGLLTMMEKDEITKKIGDEDRLANLEDQELLEERRAERNVFFGESDSEDEFLGFEGGVNSNLGIDRTVEMERSVESVQGVGEVEFGGTLRQLYQKLITFRFDGGLRVANEEEKLVYEKMKMVFEQNELEEVPGLKTQDRRKVDREVMIVEGLMHNLVKDGISVSEINRLLYVGPFCCS